MEITLNPNSDLTRGMVESLLKMMDTPEKRRNVLNELCTLRENIEGLFVYETSPFPMDKENPLFRILLMANDMIGDLIKPGEVLINRVSRYGKVVEVRSEAPAIFGYEAHKPRQLDMV